VAAQRSLTTRIVSRLSGGARRGGWLADPRLGLVYCPIPKCACSVTKYWFVHAVEEAYPKLQRGGIHRYVDERYRLDRFPAWRVGRVLRQGVSFVIVRDPIARAVSAYVAKFARFEGLDAAAKSVIEGVHAMRGGSLEFDTSREVVEGDRSSTLPASSKVDYDAGISFRDFVEYISATPDERLNPHFRSQHWFLDGHRFTVLGIQERLSETLEEVGRRIGVKAPLPDEPGSEPEPTRIESVIDVPSGALRRTGVTPTIASLIDEPLRAKLVRRYAADLGLHKSVALKPRAIWSARTPARGVR